MTTKYLLFVSLILTLSFNAVGQTRYSRTYHNNGNIKSEGNLINGEPDGEWRIWSQDSLLVTSTIYKNGVIQSETKYNSRGEVIKMTDGTLHGDYALETTYQNGYVSNRRWIEFRNNRFGSYGRYNYYGSSLQLKDSAQLSYWTYQYTFDKLGRRRYNLPRVSFYENNRLREVSYEGVSVSFDKEGRINRYSGPIDASLEMYTCSFQTYDGKVLVRKKNKPVEVDIKASSFVGIVSLEVDNGLPKGTWVAKYPNGKTWFKMSFKEGFVHGKYETYYANGTSRLKTSFDKDHVNGDYNEWFSDGKPMLVGKCDQGKMIGDWKLLSDSGIDLTTFSVYEDSYDGWYIRKRLDGNPISKTYYDKGVVNGESLEYSSNGQIQQSRYYKSGKLLNTVKFDHHGRMYYYKEEGIFTFNFHGNGNIQSIWYGDDVNGMSMSLDSNGKPERYHYNSAKTYSLFGQYKSDTLYRYTYEISGEQIDLKPYSFITSWPKKYVGFKGETKNNKRIGEWIIYHPTGAVWAKGSYENGLLNGLWEYYNLDGKKIAEKHFNQGILNGVCTVWDFYGNTKRQIEYEDGDYDGLYKKWFDEKDQISNINHYKAGKLEGKQTFYNQEGVLITESTYLNGEQNGVFKTYNRSTGHLETESFYVNNKRSGVYKLFDASGNVLTSTEYSNGIKHGYTKRFDGAGNLLKSEKFEYGELIEEKSNIPCGCESGDASLVRARYFPSVKDLADWNEVLFYMDGKIQIPKRTYERTFYSQLQPVGGLGSSNRLDIVNRNEFAIEYIENPGLSFVINPCLKQNEFSKISFMAHMDYPIKRLTDKTYDPNTFDKTPRAYFDVALQLNDLSVRDILYRFKRYFGYNDLESTKGLKRALAAYDLAPNFNWEEQEFEELVALLAPKKEELLESVYHECFNVPTLDYDNFPNDYRKFKNAFDVFFGHYARTKTLLDIDALFEKSLEVEFGNKQLGVDFPMELLTPVTPVVKTLGGQLETAQVRLLMNVVAFSYNSTSGIVIDRPSNFCFTPCYFTGTTLTLAFDSTLLHFNAPSYYGLRLNDTLTTFSFNNGIRLMHHIKVPIAKGTWVQKGTNHSFNIQYENVYLQGEYVVGVVSVKKNSIWSSEVQNEFATIFDDFQILENSDEKLRALFLFKSKF